MSDVQLYFAIGLPSALAFIGILVNVGYFVAINSRIQSLQTRLDGRINSLDGRFDLLMGKVFEIDNRLARVEEQLKH